MRAFSRTAASITAVLILTAGSAACSNGNLDEPSLTAVSTMAKEGKEPATDSAEASTSADAGSKETKEEPTASKSPEASESKPDSKKKESADDSGYSYDRVKNSDGYIVDVGLGEAGKKASFPACDGRYILIVDSVIAKGDDGTTFNDLARAVLTDGPSGKEFTVPGQCDSLRKSVHGNDIYPVYLDFGSDKAAACRAKSTYGGNVRPLISGSFPDASNSDVDEARLALDPC